MGCSMSGVSNNSQQVRLRKPINRYQRVGKTEKSHQLCHDASFDTTKSSEAPWEVVGVETQSVLP